MCWPTGPNLRSLATTGGCSGQHFTYELWLEGGQRPVQPRQAGAPALAAAQAQGSLCGAGPGDAELPVLDQPQPRVVELLVLRGETGESCDSAHRSSAGLASGFASPSSCPRPPDEESWSHGKTLAQDKSSGQTQRGLQKGLLPQHPRPQTRCRVLPSCHLPRLHPALGGNWITPLRWPVQLAAGSN